MTNMPAGGLRSRKISRQPCRRKVARLSGLGADLAHRFQFAKRQQSRKSLRPAGNTVLGSPSSCSARAKPSGKRETTATKTRVLCQQRLYLGRCNSLRPAYALGRAAIRRLLGRTRRPRNSQSRGRFRPCKVSASFNQQVYAETPQTQTVKPGTTKAGRTNCLCVAAPKLERCSHRQLSSFCLRSHAHKSRAPGAARVIEATSDATCRSPALASSHNSSRADQRSRARRQRQSRHWLNQKEF
jgi:hypothetical protein